MALKTFNRPATRLELSTECGLDRDAVHAGLKRLKAIGVLVETGGERMRGLYALTADAELTWSKTRSHYIRRDSAKTKIAYKPRRKRLGIELGRVAIDMPEFDLGKYWKGSAHKPKGKRK